MDVEGGIAAGQDFVRVLEEQVSACDVLLALIGPKWLTATDEMGRRRLDNREDFVRIEIASALRLGKRVIPVLVHKTEMPRAEALPEPLKPLARRNAVGLTRERFQADAQGLIKALEDALAEAEAARQRAATEVALRQWLPTMSSNRFWPEAGGLISYGANASDVYRRSAELIDKFLRGTKPANIPVEQPTKFELVLNLKTAKALGLSIPPTLLALADEVIE